MNPEISELGEADRRLIAATQAGLPLSTRPYDSLARMLGVSQEEVLSKLARMIDDGAIRRIAAVPNHYALGYRANGMSVWDVEDAEADVIGREIGDLPFVSHCYLRPRHPPEWPYNLFAMVHGHCRAEVEAKIGIIADRLGSRQRSHDVLYSKRILKKTGLRLSTGG